MITFILSLDDALRCRFAISPAGEVVRLARAIVRSTAKPRGDTAWMRSLRPQLKGLQSTHDLRLLLTLLRAPYYPDFWLPIHETPIAAIHHELHAIRQTPEAEARRQIERSLAMLDTVDPEVADQLRDRKQVERLAEAVEAVWTYIVAPEWPRLQDVLERDVVYRARELARGGFAAVIADLEPLITLDPPHLVIKAPQEATRATRWSRPDDAAVGVRLATCRDRLRRVPGDSRLPLSRCGVPISDSRNDATALANLIGPTRAQILRELEMPAHSSADTRPDNTPRPQYVHQPRLRRKATASCPLRTALAFAPGARLHGPQAQKRSSRALALRQSLFTRRTAFTHRALRAGTNIFHFGLCEGSLGMSATTQGVKLMAFSYCLEFNLRIVGDEADEFLDYAARSWPAMWESIEGVSNALLLSLMKTLGASRLGSRI